MDQLPQDPLLDLYHAKRTITFYASIGHHASTIVDSFVAHESEFFLGDLLVQWDAPALVQAARDNATHVTAIELLAGVEVAETATFRFLRWIWKARTNALPAVFEDFANLVFGSVVETRNGLEGQQAIAAQSALESVMFPVHSGADFQMFQFVGNAAFRDDVTVAAFVVEATAFQYGAID